VSPEDYGFSALGSTPESQDISHFVYAHGIGPSLPEKLGIGLSPDLFHERGRRDFRQGDEICLGGGFKGFDDPECLHYRRIFRQSSDFPVVLLGVDLEGKGGEK